MAYTGKEKSNLQYKEFERADAQNSVPNCPYTHSKCVRYNPYKQRGICQNHGNKNAKSIRCPSLPYFISNGWRIAVLKGGRLHV